MNNNLKIKEWFYSAGGQVKGPVGIEAFYKVLRSGVLDSENDLAWNEHMEDWKPLAEIEEISHALSLKKRRTKPRPITEHGPNVVAVPSPPPLDLIEHREPQFVPFGEGQDRRQAETGIGRGTYLGTHVLLIGALVFLVYAMDNFLTIALDGMPWVDFVIPGVAIILTGFFIHQSIRRFENVGMSGWWLVVHLLFPIANIWTGYRLFAAPAGYSRTHKLDVPGVFLAILFLLPSLLLLGGMGYLTYTVNQGGFDALPPAVAELASEIVPQISAAIAGNTPAN